MEKMFVSMKDLKVGKYVLIEDIPCRIAEIESSSPGKHGAAKMRVTAMGIFDGQKKTLLKPGDADIEVPIIERKVGQVMNVSGNMAQVMDSESFEMFDLPIPEDIAGVEAGKEVEYMRAMGRRIMTRTRV